MSRILVHHSNALDHTPAGADRSTTAGHQLPVQTPSSGNPKCPHFCPICMNYHGRIAMTTCCGNNLCPGCLRDMLEKAASAAPLHTVLQQFASVASAPYARRQVAGSNDAVAGGRRTASAGGGGNKKRSREIIDGVDADGPFGFLHHYCMPPSQANTTTTGKTTSSSSTSGLLMDDSACGPVLEPLSVVPCAFCCGVMKLRVVNAAHLTSKVYADSPVAPAEKFVDDASFTAAVVSKVPDSARDETKGASSVADDDTDDDVVLITPRENIVPRTVAVTTATPLTATGRAPPTSARGVTSGAADAVPTPVSSRGLAPTVVATLSTTTPARRLMIPEGASPAYTPARVAPAAASTTAGPEPVFSPRTPYTLGRRRPSTSAATDAVVDTSTARATVVHAVPAVVPLAFSGAPAMSPPRAGDEFDALRRKLRPMLAHQFASSSASGANPASVAARPLPVSGLPPRSQPPVVSQRPLPLPSAPNPLAAPPLPSASSANSSTASSQQQQRVAAGSRRASRGPPREGSGTGANAASQGGPARESRKKEDDGWSCVVS